MSPQRSSQSLLAAGAVVVAVVAVFYPVLGHPFVHWDDQINIHDNPLLNPPSADSLATIWRRSYEGLYIPLTYTAWWLLSLVGASSPRPSVMQFNPAVFHGACLSLHLLSTIFVWRILARLGAGAVPAAIGAALFGLHPVQVEPVAWASGLKDTLCGALALAAAWAFLASLACERRKAALRFVVATGLFVLSLLAKPAAVTLPLICAAMAFLVDPPPQPGRRKPLLAGLGGWLVLGFASALWTSAAQPLAADVPRPALALRPLIALDALAFYIRQILVPAKLVPDYGRSPDVVLGSAAVAVTWLIPVGTLVLAAFVRQRRTALLILAIFVAALLPVLGLTPFNFQVYSTVADRYLYLAMLAPAILLARLLQSLWRSKTPSPKLAPCPQGELCGEGSGSNAGRAASVACEPSPNGQGTGGRGPCRAGIALRERLALPLTIAACGVLAAFAVRSAVQVRHWQSTRALFTHNLDAVPRSLAARKILAFDTYSRGQVDVALALYRSALEIRPDDSLVHRDMGVALLKENCPAEALEHLAAAHRLRPRDVGLMNNLAIALMRTNRMDDAAAVLRKLLAMDDNHIPAHLFLGAYALEHNDSATAVEHFQAVLRIDPTNHTARDELARLRR